MKQTIAIIALAIAIIFGGISGIIKGNQIKELQVSIGELQETAGQEPTIIDNTITETPIIEQTVRTTMPEGHWEAYCIYPENENGYRTRGAMIRVSDGDCKSNWRVVEVWER